MRRRTTWLGGIAAAALASPFLPDWLTAAGLDVWNAPALERQMAANRRNIAAIDAELAEVREHVRAKELLANELLAGRLSLDEVTDRFEEMLHTHERVLIGLRCRYPDAANDRVRVARHVVDYARVRAADEAAWESAAPRVAAELNVLVTGAHPHPAG